MTTLARELDAFLADFDQRVPADIRAMMRDADDELRLSGIGDRVLKEGATAPDFALPDATGRTVRLADRLAAGPVVLTFYRGGWCPYCTLELRAWQRLLPDLAALGGRVVAVSPQTPDASLSTAEKHGLGFDVLSDRGSRVAEAYGLAFPLPQALRDLYTRFGHPLPAVNGTDDWRLPVPGTFVIAPSGRMLRAHADVDYRTRLEPAEALAALRAAVEAV